MKIILKTPLSIEESAERLSGAFGEPLPPLWAVIFPDGKWHAADSPVVRGRLNGCDLWIERTNTLIPLASSLLCARMERDPAAQGTTIAGYTRWNRYLVVGFAVLGLIWLLGLLSTWFDVASRQEMPWLIVVGIGLAVVYAGSFVLHRREDQFLLDFLKKTIDAVPVERASH